MRFSLAVIAFSVLMIGSPGPAPAADDTVLARWLDHFAFREPAVNPTGVCKGEIGQLPAFEVTAKTLGEHLVRVSIPFAPGTLPSGLGLTAHYKGKAIPADLRILTLHPGQPESVRCGMITFPFKFNELVKHRFSLRLTSVPPRTLPEAEALQDGPAEDGLWNITFAGTDLTLHPGSVTVRYQNGTTWNATLIAPSVTTSQTKGEVIERGEHYLWLRLLVADPLWPRIIEARVDSLGTVTIEAHIHRLDMSGYTAPDLGWTIQGPAVELAAAHSFSSGEPLTVVTNDHLYQLSFPLAHHVRCGSVESIGAADVAALRYYRCQEAERVPFQPYAWRRAQFVIGRRGHTPRNVLLQPDIAVAISAEDYDIIYQSGVQPDVSLWSTIDDAYRRSRQIVKKSMLVGDDLGAVTTFNLDGSPGICGQNRLNHGIAIFEEAFRSGDRDLIRTALLWCHNMHDISIWWDDDEELGGTRYPIRKGHYGGSPYSGAGNEFMWRGDGAEDFTTKGIDAFFYAYEQTGDPRMATALRHQIDYSMRHVHTDRGECRNIGDVADFMRLHRFTGVTAYGDKALELFAELRTKLSANDLFSQGGSPIKNDVPFVDADRGFRGYAKPYIIGYSLYGLPELLKKHLDEPRLRDVVRAVADFMADAQDPLGGWRYPHPKSSRILAGQSLEHAVQLCRGAEVLESRGEPIEQQLDAIERTLQLWVNFHAKTGTFLGSTDGWEASTGFLKKSQTLSDLYSKQEERDPTRDYTDGKLHYDSMGPDGVVNFGEVLSFYMKHRPAERLLNKNEVLNQVLARVPDQRLRLRVLGKGTSLRIERPDLPKVRVRLRTPESCLFPELTGETLADIDINWQRDEASGAVWYTLDRPEGSLTAHFAPHVDYVECSYTVWPKGDVYPSGPIVVAPCMQMQNSVFEGTGKELTNRVRFLVDGTWKCLGTIQERPDPMLMFLKNRSAPVRGISGWQTIDQVRPDQAIVACTSRDGKWIAATAGERAHYIACDPTSTHGNLYSLVSAASLRGTTRESSDSIEDTTPDSAEDTDNYAVEEGVPLRSDGPTTWRTNVYLVKGSLEALADRCQHDVARWQADSAPTVAEERTVEYGVRARVPSISNVQVRRLDFPLSWQQAHQPFQTWRAEARRVYIKHLQPPPPQAPFAAKVIAVEDRGSYEARKIALNLSADNRIVAYLLVPKGPGPFPGMIALHDHGGHFLIGKEKVIRPIAASQEIVEDAQEWIDKVYDGSYLGDELAQRGYVVLAIDALFWGDRGNKEGISHTTQQALYANMLQIGRSWPGSMVWDDIRSAEFLQSLPMVIPGRIGCVGHSMGGNRTWHLAAATDIVQCGAAICWMADTQALTAVGNHQTGGHSAFSMIHAGLRYYLDYPDVAAIACPKPMLFFNGSKDSLFPVPGVNRSYDKMRTVWTSQSAGDRFVGKLWDTGHGFNAAMQKEAFAWLDGYLKLTEDSAIESVDVVGKPRLTLGEAIPTP